MLLFIVTFYVESNYIQDVQFYLMHLNFFETIRDFDFLFLQSLILMGDIYILLKKCYVEWKYHG